MLKSVVTYQMCGGWSGIAQEYFLNATLSVTKLFNT